MFVYAYDVLCMRGDFAHLGDMIGRWLVWLALMQRFDWLMAGVICPVLLQTCLYACLSQDDPWYLVGGPFNTTKLRELGRALKTSRVRGLRRW